MRKGKHLAKRTLAIVLSAVLALGCVDLQALAESEDFEAAVAEAVADEAAVAEAATTASEEGTSVEANATEAATAASEEEIAAEIAAVETVTDEAVEAEAAEPEPVIEQVIEAEPEDSLGEDELQTYAADVTGDITVDDNGIITKYTGNVPVVDIPSEVVKESDGSTVSVTVKGIANKVFQNHTEITSVKFPPTLVSIGAEAFSGCTSLFGDFKIPQSVTSVGNNAFKGCGKIENMTFEDTSEPTPETLTVGTSVFEGCSNLKTITLSKRVRVIPEYFAKNCGELTTVNWSTNLTSIGYQAFYGCAKLTSAKLSGNTGLTSIGGQAFYSCSDLTELTLENTALTTIGKYAFYGCSKLYAPVFPKTLTTIGEGAFKNARMGTPTVTSNLVIPASVDTIAAGAFENCSMLGTVSFENTSVAGAAAISFPVYGNQNSWDANYNHSSVFRNCPSLTKITLSNRIGVIPQFFAEGCKNLEEVVWSASNTDIKWCAFSGCVKLPGADISGTQTNVSGNRLLQAVRLWRL